jgi:hypothetical protein
MLWGVWLLLRAWAAAAMSAEFLRDNPHPDPIMISTMSPERIPVWIRYVRAYALILDVPPLLLIGVA